MPTVHGSGLSPFVRKVRAFLAEKGIPYDLDPVIPFTAGPEFRKLSPLGRIPAYRDGDHTLSDSSIICAYIERTHPEPRLYPSDPYDYARALWFEEYADGGLAPIVGPKAFFRKVVGQRFFNQQADEAVNAKAVNAELPPLFDYLEGQLANGSTIVGKQLTIGDIGIGTQFVNLRHGGYGVDAKRWPTLEKYIASLHARPSFKAL